METNTKEVSEPGGEQGTDEHKDREPDYHRAFAAMAMTLDLTLCEVRPTGKF